MCDAEFTKPRPPAGSVSLAPRRGRAESAERRPGSWGTRAESGAALEDSLCPGVEGQRVGARTRAQLRESLGALALNLSQADMARIEEAMPPDGVAGGRYDAHQMRALDSER